jgi:PKD repeat protein
LGDAINYQIQKLLITNFFLKKSFAMTMFKKSNIRIFLFFILGALVLQSAKCIKDPVDPTPSPKVAPVADFTASATSIMAGESITFTDVSKGYIKSRDWQIAGGTPNSAATAIITAKFEEEGTFNVNMTIGNDIGNSTKTLVVTVKPVTFVHTVTAANTSLYTTIIDNPATNGNPNAILIFSCNYGTTGPNHNRPLSAFYNTANGGRWSVANEDFGAMPIGAKFNVMVKKPSDKAFIAIPSQISFSSAILNHPSLNGNPNAKFLITLRLEGGRQFNNSALFTWYDGSSWRIHNSNLQNMPTSIRFNILIDEKIFSVQTTVDTKNDFEIVHAATDGKPNALLFGTHTQYLTGAGNQSQIGFYFNTNTNRWFVFNENLENMTKNCRFMVLSNQQ